MATIPPTNQGARPGLVRYRRDGSQTNEFDHSCQELRSSGLRVTMVTELTLCR